ncbi:hypothetical protein AD948_10540 [Acetobacter senegalensis]|uniref:Uncharacterized protein n=1 Tax=Acetobacter senegalensis TaxID=446692 RepID=A0A149TZV9_9PROT|nr:hypothetical protein AD948_10540 [Acetobacter senegalensis]
MSIVEMPEPPYYAVIFTLVRTETSGRYHKTALEMLRLAGTIAAFLGIAKCGAESPDMTS